MPQRELKIFPDLASLTQEAAQRVVAAAEAKIADNQHFFSLFLSGGTTPKALYETLAAEPYRSQLNWSKVSIFFGDERCVPPDHPDSNFLMAHTAMLSKLPIPDPSIHRMRGEIDPQQAATDYGQLLKSTFHSDGPNMLLLGMGDDGHTASLFPETQALEENDHRCVANFVPKMNSWRLTLTYPFLNKSHNVLILVAGKSKAQSLAEVLEGPRQPRHLPIQGINPQHGQVTWLVDEAAASALKNKS